MFTVSNLSQLLQRSALTNYCIDLLATNLSGTIPERLTSATYPIYHQKTSTVSCQITLNSLQTLVGTPAAENWCGSQLSNTLAPRLDCRFIRLYFFVFRLFNLKKSSIKLKFSRPRYQAKNQEPSSRAQIKSEKRPMSSISANQL